MFNEAEKIFRSADVNVRVPPAAGMRPRGMARSHPPHPLHLSHREAPHRRPHGARSSLPIRHRPGPRDTPTCPPTGGTNNPFAGQRSRRAPPTPSVSPIEGHSLPFVEIGSAPAPRGPEDSPCARYVPQQPLCWERLLSPWTAPFAVADDDAKQTSPLFTVSPSTVSAGGRVNLSASGCDTTAYASSGVFDAVDHPARHLRLRRGGLRRQAGCPVLRPVQLRQ